MREILRNWLAWLRERRSLAVCCLQARDPGSQWCCLVGPECLRTGQADGWNPVPRAWEGTGCPHSSRVGGSKKGQIPPFPTLGSVQALCGLAGTHPPWRAVCPAEGTDSNARLLQEHRHRHTQKCLIWAPCSQSELTIQNDFKTVNVYFSSPSLC